MKSGLDAVVPEAKCTLPLSQGKRHAQTIVHGKIVKPCSAVWHMYRTESGRGRARAREGEGESERGRERERERERGPVVEETMLGERSGPLMGHGYLIHTTGVPRSSEAAPPPLGLPQGLRHSPTAGS